MTRDEALAKIRSRGYWRVNFRPLDPDDQIENLVECRTLVERSRLTARGWDFPQIVQYKADDGSRGDRILERCYEVWSTSTLLDDLSELWRMYMSSQFIHLNALSEDWKDVTSNRLQPPPPVTPKRVFAVFKNSWIITEVFVFLSRLAEQGLYKSGADVSIQLMNTEGRVLYLDRDGRVPFSRDYRTDADSLTRDSIFSRQEISEPKERAVDTLAYFFGKFQWAPARDQLAQMVEELFKPW